MKMDKSSNLHSFSSVDYSGNDHQALDYLIQKETKSINSKSKKIGTIMTNETNKQRREMIFKSLQTYKDSGQKKTLSIEYRGVDTALEVIRIHPKYLLLNHDNSRLSAQLMDHPLLAQVEKNPTSSDAQEVLASLLRKTERFNKLKDELSDLKQQNPGLISRDGLLINGNTRVVALRDLGEDGVDVAVLPEDAMARDFLDLEMSLQMRKLTHQDYTFTNELLLIEKYKNAGHTEKELVKKMGWGRNGKKKVREASQLLGLVNEIRGNSTVPLAYEVFDSKSQHLKDLNEEFNNTSQHDLAEANQMKWSRVASMFLGINKDQTRVIKPGFFEEDVIKRLEPNSKASTLLNSLKKVNVESDEHDLLLGAPEESEKIDAKELAKKIITSVVDENGFLTKELPQEYQDIHKAIRLGTEATITQGKREKLLLEPADVLNETRISLESILDAFADVSKLKEFDAKKFEFELLKVTKCISELTEDFYKLKKNKCENDVCQL